MNTNFTDSVNSVKIDTSTVTIRGTVSDANAAYYLAEIEPQQYDFEQTDYSFVTPLTIDSNEFKLTLKQVCTKN